MEEEEVDNKNKSNYQNHLNIDNSNHHYYNKQHDQEDLEKDNSNNQDEEDHHQEEEEDNEDDYDDEDSINSDDVEDEKDSINSNDDDYNKINEIQQKEIRRIIMDELNDQEDRYIIKSYKILSSGIPIINVLEKQSKQKYIILAFKTIINTIEQEYGISQSGYNHNYIDRYLEILRECSELSDNFQYYCHQHISGQYRLIFLQKFEQDLLCCDLKRFNNISRCILVIKYGQQILNCLSKINESNYVLLNLSLDHIFLDIDSNLKLFNVGQTQIIHPNNQQQQEQQLQSLSNEITMTIADIMKQSIYHPPESMQSNNNLAQPYYENIQTNIWKLAIVLLQIAGVSITHIYEFISQYNKNNNDSMISQFCDLPEQINLILSSMLQNNPNNRPTLENLIIKFKELETIYYNQQTAEQIYDFIQEQNNILQQKRKTKDYQDKSNKLDDNIVISLINECIKMNVNEEKHLMEKYYFYLGLSYYNLKEYYKSHVKLNNALSLNEKNEDALLLRGIIYYKEQSIEASLETLIQLRDLNKSSNYLCEYYIAINQYELQQYDHALHACLASLALNPYLYKSYVLLTLLQTVNKQYNNALESCNKAMELKNNSFKAYISLAFIYYDQNEFEKSKQILEKTIKMKKSSPTPYYYIGSIFYKLYKNKMINQKNIKQKEENNNNSQNYLKKAIKYFKKSLEKDENYHHSSYKLGLIYEKKYQDQKNENYLALAEYYYQTCTGSDSYNNLYLNQFGVFYYNIKEYTKAIEWFKQVILNDKKNNQFESALLNICLSYEKLGEFKKAIKYAERLLELNKNNQENISLLADFYRKNGENQKAKELYLSRLEQNKNNDNNNELNSYCYEELGYISFKENNYLQAIENYNNALQINPNLINCHLNLGMAYSQLNQIDTAIHHLIIANQLKPQDEIVLNDLSEIYYNKQQYNQAIIYLQELISVKPQDNKIKLKLAYCYYQINDEQKINLKNNEAQIKDSNSKQENNFLVNSEQLLKEILKFKNNQLLSYKEIGNEYYFNKLYNESIYFYKLNLEINPTDYITYYHLGNSLKQLNKLNEAEQNYSHCQEYLPDQYNCYRQLGDIYLQQNEFKKSEFNLEKCLEIKKNDSKCYQILGKLYMKQKLYKQSISFLQKSIEIYPKEKENLKFLGLVYYQYTDYIQAEHYLGQYYKIKPNDQQVLIALGKCESQKEDYNQAIIFYKKCLVQNPKSEEALYEISMAYKRKKNYRNAINYMKKCIDINPTCSEYYESIGILYKKTKNYKESIKCHLYIQELQPQNDNNIMNLGNTYLAMSDISAAIDCFERCIAINPNDSLFYSNLATVYNQCNAFDEAIINYKKCLELKQDDFRCLQDLGYVYDKASQFDNALECYKIGMEKDSKSGITCMLRGWLDEAKKYYEDSLISKDKNGKVICNLGYVLIEQGKNSEALEILDSEQRVFFSNTLNAKSNATKTYAEQHLYYNQKSNLSKINQLVTKKIRDKKIIKNSNNDNNIISWIPF